MDFNENFQYLECLSFYERLGPIQNAVLRHRRKKAWKRLLLTITVLMAISFIFVVGGIVR